MAYVTSPSEICNLALSILKVDENITSVESPLSAIERVCAQWYDVTRRELLRSHPWSFARKRASIARNATAPEFGYDDAYNLPNDFIRLLFNGESYTVSNPDYSIENGQILVNNDGAALDICYVYDVTSVVKMDPLFIDLFAMELALKMFPALVGIKPSVQALLASERNRLISQARSINGQENPVKVVHKSDLLTARDYGRTRYDRYNKVVGY